MNEYVTVGATARAHSDNGNLKDNGSLTFVYDYKNRLIGAFDKATNNPVAAYLYYCDNRRAKKIVYSQTSPGVVERQERFFYDGQQVVEETDDAGNTLLSWVYSPVYVDEPVQMVRSASHSLGAGTFYLHQNARADVVAVTDSAGSVVERRLFDDYGRSFDGVSKAPVSGSAVGNVYGFQGRRLDAETGLYYFRARYYDPSTGRFVQRDPVWDPGNYGNQYSFVGGSPVSGLDPEGLSDLSERKAMREYQAQGPRNRVFDRFASSVVGEKQARHEMQAAQNRLNRARTDLARFEGAFKAGYENPVRRTRQWKDPKTGLWSMSVREYEQKIDRYQGAITKAEARAERATQKHSRALTSLNRNLEHVRANSRAHGLAINTGYLRRALGVTAAMGVISLLGLECLGVGARLAGSKDFRNLVRYLENNDKYGLYLMARNRHYRDRMEMVVRTGGGNIGSMTEFSPAWTRLWKQVEARGKGGNTKAHRARHRSLNAAHRVRMKRLGQG